MHVSAKPRGVAEQNAKRRPLLPSHQGSRLAADVDADVAVSTASIIMSVATTYEEAPLLLNLERDETTGEWALASTWCNLGLWPTDAEAPCSFRQVDRPPFAAKIKPVLTAPS